MRNNRPENLTPLLSEPLRVLKSSIHRDKQQLQSVDAAFAKRSPTWEITKLFEMYSKQLGDELI